MGLIQLAQDRHQWLALVNTVKKPLDSITCREFIDWMSDYQLHKKGSDPRRN
jgi:hypothetical protein